MSEQQANQQQSAQQAEPDDAAVFRVYSDDPTNILNRVFCLLKDDHPMAALSACCEYYAALNAQTHVNMALGLYKDKLKRLAEKEKNPTDGGLSNDPV